MSSYVCVKVGRESGRIKRVEERLAHAVQAQVLHKKASVRVQLCAYDRTSNKAHNNKKINRFLTHYSGTHLELMLGHPCCSTEKRLGPRKAQGSIETLKSIVSTSVSTHTVSDLLQYEYCSHRYKSSYYHDTWTG